MYGVICPVYDDSLGIQLAFAKTTLIFLSRNCLYVEIWRQISFETGLGANFDSFVYHTSLLILAVAILFAFPLCVFKKLQFLTNWRNWQQLYIPSELSKRYSNYKSIEINFFANIFRTNNNGVETVETYENDILKNRTVSTK